VGFLGGSVGRRAIAAMVEPAKPEVEVGGGGYHLLAMIAPSLPSFAIWNSAVQMVKDRH